MWVRKHAPVSMDEVVGNSDIVSRFKSMCESGYMQHMILCGPAGVGKNTLLQLLMRNVLGAQYEDGTLIFSSSDNKSNQRVRDKIHQFVPKRLNNARTKFVVFKQAELLSEGVQQVMRRLMEQHYHHTVFVFVCSHIGNLLETIQSRCHIYRFRQISVADQQLRLQQVLTREGMGDAASTTAACERIAKMSNGDLRFCLNYLQVHCASARPCAPAAEQGQGPMPASSDTPTSEPPGTCTTCLFPYDDKIAEFFERLLDTSAPKSVKAFHHCVACLKELVLKGYCGRDVIVFLNHYIVANDERIPRRLALEWLKHIALCQHRMITGVDSFLQICALVATMYRCVCTLHVSTTNSDTTTTTTTTTTTPTPTASAPHTAA